MVPLLLFVAQGSGAAGLSSQTISPVSAAPTRFPNPVITGVTFPLAVLAADFNGDGRRDLAVLHGLSLSPSSEVIIFLANGDGTFRSQAGPMLGTTQVVWAATDFNGDGIVDLAAGDFVSGAQVLRIFSGKGDGTFDPVYQLELSALPTVLATGDLNRDGRVDLVVAGYCADAQCSTGNVAVYAGNVFHHSARSSVPFVLVV